MSGPDDLPACHFPMAKISHRDRCFVFVFVFDVVVIIVVFLVFVVVVPVPVVVLVDSAYLILSGKGISQSGLVYIGHRFQRESCNTQRTLHS